MRIAYFTFDDVNRYLVRRWASAAGARVACQAGRPSTCGMDETAAVVLDLDFLPSDVRAAWVGLVLAGEVRCPVLVHGHNISDSDASALGRRGVRVCRGRIRRAALMGWLDGVLAVRRTVT